MAKHLTDREKKKIIADYAECGNYSQVARKHKVSFDTVKRVVISDPETVKKAEQKKEQNTADILEFMDKKKDDVCSIISLYLSELQNSDKLQRASIQSIATSVSYTHLYYLEYLNIYSLQVLLVQRPFYIKHFFLCTQSLPILLVKAV